MIVRHAYKNQIANRRPGKFAHAVCGTLVLIAAATALSGCSRTFWRKQADRDAYDLVGEKLNDRAWSVPRVDITPDPRSRFYDPYDIDKGPLPPDDVAAGEYMLQVAGKRGYKSWHKFGEALSIENPHWLESFGLSQQMIQQVSHSETGEPSSSDALPTLENVTMQQALELSYIHSRDYQTAIEDVYLRALELSFERFQFDVRYLGIGGQRPTADLTQSSVPSTSDNLTANSRAGISQLLPSGGQWAVELANQTIWMFSGPNTTNTASTISYSLVQPLLFQAGRKIALENLTQSERNLLYSVRTLARFRKEFFTDVIGGNSGLLPVLRQRQLVLNNEDNIRRNVEQLEVLTVLASQMTIEYYESLEALPPNIEFPPTVSSQIRYGELEKRLYWRGRMSPIQAQTLLALSPNAAWQTAIRSLSAQRIYETLEAIPAGITIPPGIAAQLSYNAAEKRLYWIGLMSEPQEKLLLSLHPGEAWQNAVGGLIKRLRAEILTSDILRLQNRLLSSQNDLRDSERGYQNSLDLFKTQLGLPPNLPLSVDESLLKQFQLIDPRVYSTEGALKQFVIELSRLDQNNPDLAQLRTVLAGLKQLRDRLQTDVLDVIDADLTEVKRLLPSRLAQLSTKDERAQLRSDIDRGESLLLLTRNAFRRNSRELDNLIRVFESSQVSNDNEWKGSATGALGIVAGLAVVDAKRAARDQIAVLRENLLKITQNAQVIEFGLRVELIPLEQYRDSMEVSVKNALENRLDLKNIRAQVMDARRRVEVAANALESVLNIRVEGDISTRPGNNKPLDFRGKQSNFRVGVGFTAPLDQVNARNQYRDAQIAYQRARRAYMALEDQIKLSVRASWRQLNVSRINFETARQQVRISALQFDSTVEEAVNPEQQGAANRNSGLNLLNALTDVLNAQNGLIRIWVQYEQSRLNIHRDMGIMEIDARGVWTDDYYQRRFPTFNVVPPQPAPSEGRLPNATHARTASKPRLFGLERIAGSVRIRGNAGSLDERNRVARNHVGDVKRSRVDPWSSGGTVTQAVARGGEVADGDDSRGGARRGRGRVSVSPR